MKALIDKSLHRESIRSHVRRRRRSLTYQEQMDAAHKVANRVLSDMRIQRAQNLALFLSVDGELDTRFLIRALWLGKKQVYLPVLHPFTPGSLIFLHYTISTPLVLNRFKIREPRLDITTLLPLKKLDVLFIPLVAFDRFGNRLGMGGGFYDRILQNEHYDMTCLPIGLAHDCQKTEEALPIEEWDIPLPEIITPSRYWCWR